ncbi:MAG TPA: HEPN domain-containing protein [Candidatus Sulfotelmatobacter sp.]|jgi:uncharacterized protein (UPF0332 family)|nr:HEPN domain-containing protein [Candidatus Sulfotelmatobacter sp.]
MGAAHTSSLAEKLLGKAEVKLGAARELFVGGFFEDSASRSYYAMFHAARAALTKVGVTTRTHEGTVSEFGRRLVMEGVFSRDLGKALAEAKAARETYEYSATMEIERGEAEALLRDAENFVAQVKSKLRSLKPLFADTKGAKTRLSVDHDKILYSKP